MLLPPDQYYRPTRAAELREQAARLRRWQIGLGELRDWLALVILGGWCLLNLSWITAAGFKAAALFEVAWMYLIGSLIVAASLTNVAVLYDRLLVTPVSRRAVACEREAEALEREHQARHGTDPLPLAGEPPCLP
jgi:hypothetical protein